MMRRVYLDNNATTPVLPKVLEAMRPYFGEHFGNASSIHHHGQETRAAVERARESVAALLGHPTSVSSPAMTANGASTSSEHALVCWSMIFPENRYPLFGIML